MTQPVCVRVTRAKDGAEKIVDDPDLFDAIMAEVVAGAVLMYEGLDDSDRYYPDERATVGPDGE